MILTRERKQKNFFGVSRLFRDEWLSGPALFYVFPFISEIFGTDDLGQNK